MKTSACRDGTLKTRPNKIRTTLQHIHTIPTSCATLHNPYQPHSAAIKFHNIKLKFPTYPTDPALLTVSAYCIQFLHITVSIHRPCSVATTLHPPTTLHTPHAHQHACTTHPTILPSTTLLCTQLSNSGTRCRDGVNVLQCRSHLVWPVFEGSIPTCACFHLENFFVTCISDSMQQILRWWYRSTVVTEYRFQTVNSFFC